MSEIEKIELDDKQEDIVYYPGEKPLSVEAGPGAGKTRVIIERVKYLIKEKKIDPETLLVITFTRKAAEELKERLADSDIPKSEIDLMQISTIHGFCSKILENNGAVGFDVIDDDLNEKTNMFISRHLKDLGFVDEFKLPQREIRDVVDKYNEYTTFNVDTKKLIEYIKDVRPISEEYIDFVKTYMEEHDGKFPSNEIREDKDLKKSYYNAKYLRIAESYPTYLKLLDDENLTDFSLMQVKTLEFLEKNPKTPYKNVLIDEFQDTDPVQMKIFEILMENAETFTVVGDIEQSIYGFRGSIENYFEKLYLKHTDKIEQKDLSYNYRSTDEIIDFSEDFIMSQRSEHASKSDAVGKRELHRDMYYMVSDDNVSEAKKIIDLIEYLKHSETIEEYNEIGILVRSVKNSSNCINPLIKELDEKKIPYQVKGRSDLLERSEIKSILTLYYYIIKNDDEESKHIFNRWEKDWLNLKAFTGENFPQVLVNLSDETKEILNNLQDKFEQEVLATEKIVYKELTGKSSRLKKFAGVFNRDEEVLVELFNRVEYPSLENDKLRGYGITNIDDLTFFYLLNSLRDEYLDAQDGVIEYKYQPTILETFLKLLTITDYLDEEFINNENNKNQVENIALLSNTLFNYEQVKNPKDLAGAFWFIYHNIEEYGSYTSEQGVQIMTVHKSKGLQFPVVIVASIDEKKFPMKFRDPNPESGYINGRPVYYTPNNCLEYKPFDTLDEEMVAHDAEEERIFYVAITRAQDTLILSTLSPSGSEELLEKAIKYVDNPKIDEKTKKQQFDMVIKGHDKVQEIIDSNDYCKPLHKDYSVIEKTVCKKPGKDKESIKLSFTSLENYQQCPLKYRLQNDFGLKTSETKYIDDGNFMHKAFEIINKKIKENDNVYIGDNEVKNIVTNLFMRSKFKDIDEETQHDKLNRFIEDTLYYYNGPGKDLEIVDVEVSFYIKKENYNLNGFIDLIYRTPDGKLGILDYKDTKSERKYMNKYLRQLYTYIIGLRDEENKYRHEEIGEIAIYAIKSRKLVNDLPINEIEIEELANEIDDTAVNIEEENFSSVKGDHCKKCQYSEVCKQKKNDIKLPEPIAEDTSTPKFCSNCGSKLEEGMKFCPGCGAKL